MARRAMRDHRQAPAWPKQTLSVANLRREAWEQLDSMFAEFKRLQKECQAEYLAAVETVEAFLFGLDDDELAALDPEDTRVCLPVRDFRFGEVLVGILHGLAMITDEQERRAALTGHERIAETRERMRRKAVSQ